MASKAFESYEMLAKLLNSERRENIDRAYDALASVLAESYGETKRKTEEQYAAKRDALSANRAKAEKYLDYFMTEKGYAGSGIEEDAKLKAEIGYNRDLASLYAAENGAKTDADAAYASALLKNEAERAEKLGNADKDGAELSYKAAAAEADDELQRQKLELQRQTEQKELQLKEQAQRADNEYRNRSLSQQNSLKEKEYEIKLLEAQTAAAKASAATSSQKKEAEALEKKLNSYRQLMYEEIKRDFESTDDISEMQRIYDTVTGVNAERAAEIYGEKLYKDLIKTFSKRLTDAKTKQRDDAVVQMLIDRFVEAKDEYHYDTYMRLKRAITSGGYPGYTLDQLDRVYKLYKNNG